MNHTNSPPSQIPPSHFDLVLTFLVTRLVKAPAPPEDVSRAIKPEMITIINRACILDGSDKAVKMCVWVISRKPAIGFQPQMMVDPTKTEIASEITMFLVIIASTIASTAGIIDKIP